MPPTIEIILLLSWGAACAYRDARYKRIDNWLTFPAALLAALYLFTNGHTFFLANYVETCACLLLVLALTLPGYYRHQFGAGDIKMLLVLALATAVTPLLLIFAIAGICMLLWRYSGPYLWPLLPIQARKALSPINHGQRTIAFAPFLFSGMCVALPMS